MACICPVFQEPKKRLQNKKPVSQLEQNKTKISSEVLGIWINVPEYAELKPDFSILSTNRTSGRKTNFQDAGVELSLEYIYIYIYRGAIEPPKNLTACQELRDAQGWVKLIAKKPTPCSHMKFETRIRRKGVIEIERRKYNDMMPRHSKEHERLNRETIAGRGTPSWMSLHWKGDLFRS